LKPLRVQVDGVEYLVRVPAYMIPVVNFMAPALGKVPGNLEEAVETSRELEDALKLFAERCVEPEPKPEHLVELVFKAIGHVASEVSRAVKAANFYEGTEPSAIR